MKEKENFSLRTRSAAGRTIFKDGKDPAAKVRLTRVNILRVYENGSVEFIDRGEYLALEHISNFITEAEAIMLVLQNKAVWIKHEKPPFNSPFSCLTTLSNSNSKD